MTVLATERLRIRPWHAGRTPPTVEAVDDALASGDRTALARMATDAEMMRYVTGGQPWSPERIDAFLQRQAGFAARHGLAFGAVERRSDGEVIGLCGIQPLDAGHLDGHFELGWWIWRDHWGRGYASEASRAVLEHARDVLRLDRLLAVIDPPNLASIRVAEKLGMRFTEILPARATRTDRDDKPVALYEVRFADRAGTGPPK
ncbi:GNAT family N-acetyltransferase [Halomonas denitrificans]|nr:GNAT family N-acetyltransferase [Halomonas denitrificans]